MDVVIGAAFGDEGKGVVTHYLASRYGGEAMVVRFNGGAQAGHTVVTQDGRRHVFRHVGSGTFAGSPTFLSRFFVCNPVLFWDERQTLSELGLQPRIYVDPDCLITTPYDMFINQLVETTRGHQRHGSCGVGFGETIERSGHASFALSVGDLENASQVTDTLHRIRTHWLPERLATLGLTSAATREWTSLVESEAVLDFYQSQLTTFLASIVIASMDLSRPKQPVIFEGAQGLMLDQTRGQFPHVTRSNTGLTNVLDLIQYRSSSRLNVIYVTRSYLTRHGAGALPHELPHLPYPRVVDDTNVSNPHQGALRYAWFNLPLLNAFIQSDLKRVPTTLPLQHQLAVTCLDHIDAAITFITDDEKIAHASREDFLHTVAQTVQGTGLLCGEGPTAERLRAWSTT